MGMKALLLSCALLASCATTHHETHTTPRPIGVMESLNDYVADVQISSEAVTGSAEGGTFLGLFETGTQDYAEYLAFDGKSFSPLSAFLGDIRLDEVKRAAVLDACKKAGCDVLAYPIFQWFANENIFVTEYKVQVKGFPGFIKGIKNYPRQIVPGQLRLGPNDDPVPAQNRYRIEGADGAVLQLGMAGPVSAKTSAD